jgi:hypothetical protein
MLPGCSALSPTSNPGRWEFLRNRNPDKSGLPLLQLLVGRLSADLGAGFRLFWKPSCNQ